MASHKNDLKNITYGIASSFISRNNDINGYWALGIIYKQTIELDINYLKLDLLNLITNDNRLSLSYTLNYYNKVLSKQLKQFNFTLSVLKNVTLELYFNRKPTELETLYKNVWGQPFTCVVTIISYSDRMYQTILGSCCRPHDPKRENRSLRAKSYNNTLEINI